MGEGRRTAKTQAVCVELGPLCSILGFPLPTQPSPLPPPPSYLPELLGRLYGRGSGVLDIFYLRTAFFFRLEMCHKPILCPNVAQKCKLARGYQNHRNFAWNTRGALKLRRFTSPDLASLKCYAFLRPPPKRGCGPLGGGGKGRVAFHWSHFLRIQVRNS